MAGTQVNPRYMKYQTAAQVQTLLEKVENADAEPTPESANMISSGAVSEALENFAALGEKVGDVEEEPVEQGDL